jgi:hypothetical protein
MRVVLGVVLWLCCALPVHAAPSPPAGAAAGEPSSPFLAEAVEIVATGREALAESEYAGSAVIILLVIGLASLLLMRRHGGG